MSKTEVKLLRFNEHADSRGSLIALEGNCEIPFSVKRIYYIYGNTANKKRGAHAHKNLKQLLIAIHGSISVQVEFRQQNQTYVLSSPSEGLYISGLVWREMVNFSPDSVLLVLASDNYNPEDYIRDKILFNSLSAADRVLK
ncbi:sugar 3,4-ketoisomerase [Parabacteroides johnsonii]|uniref:sugar 3,4-ketoisomerase n=1 Tax=Parabacteroides johnsonii TaxID=387661 RepID=UPI003C6E4DC6